MFRGDERKRALRFAIALICALACVTSASAAAAPSAFALPPDWQRGANFAAWWHDSYEQPEAAESLAALHRTGTSRVSLIVTWYMDSKNASRVVPDPLKTPSDESLRTAIGRARALGMSVAVKPHVDVRDGTFRGEIAPGDPPTWFADYTSMTMRYARLAEESGAEMFVVGTELTSMSEHTQRWRQLIAGLRSLFDGQLTFAANWTDGARRLEFWPDLDFIGIDAYMPLLSDYPDPSVERLASAWCETTTAAGEKRRYVDEVTALHERYEKPVLFTEMGYQSRLGTAETPWGNSPGAVSQQAQQRAYEAAFQIWSTVPWMKGVHWWNWPAAVRQPGEDGSFDFSGKAAEATVTAWNRDAAAAPASPCGNSPASERPTGRTVMSLGARVKTKRHGAKKHSAGIVRLAGRVRRAGHGCSVKVRVRVQRWNRERRRWGLLRSRAIDARATGRYRVRLQLGDGRYRARARTRSKVCSARSSYERFRI